ncbi:MAG TPA: YjbF family lipoprotein [Rhodanobacteraceae bacterium]|nr:YjbF family lipoprotein [Rhodanobacteraceae bacterium]
MRRTSLVCLWLIAALAVGGCSTLSDASVDTLGLLVHGDKSNASPTATSVAAKPYYQLEVDSEAGTALLILGNLDHGREAWYDATGGILFLHHGVLVKTWHMRPDIVGTRLSADSPFRTGLQHLQAPVKTTRSLDLPGYRYGVTAVSTLTPAGMHDVTILGTSHRLLQIDEHIQAPSVGFAADNQYWVDPQDGFVWKSRQTIPGGLTLTLTELKPYRGSGS